MTGSRDSELDEILALRSMVAKARALLPVLVDIYGPTGMPPRVLAEALDVSPAALRQGTPFPFWCDECGGEMTWRGTGARWEGDYQRNEIRLECQSTGCQTSATIVYRRFIPIDIARMQQP